MREDLIIQHLMDIKERISSIETTVNALGESTVSRDQRVTAIEQKQIKLEASDKTFRHIMYFVLITVPATAAAVYRMFKS